MIQFADGDDTKFEKISKDTVAEIRNALSIISGFAQLQLIKAKPGMIPDVRRQLEEIIHQVDRIDKLLP